MFKNAQVPRKNGGKIWRIILRTCKEFFRKWWESALTTTTTRGRPSSACRGHRPAWRSPSCCESGQTSEKKVSRIEDLQVNQVAGLNFIWNWLTTALKVPAAQMLPDLDFGSKNGIHPLINGGGVIFNFWLNFFCKVTQFRLKSHYIQPHFAPPWPPV